MQAIKFFFLLTLLCCFTTKLSAIDYYWVGGGGAWSIAKFSTTDGGTANVSQLPTANDNVYFTALSGFDTNTTAARTITLPTGGGNCKNLAFSGCQFAPILNTNNGLRINGSLELQAGMTMSGSGGITFTSPDTETIKWNGVSSSTSLTFTSAGGTGSWEFEDDYRCTGIGGISVGSGKLILDNRQIVFNLGGSSFQGNIGVSGSAQISMKNVDVAVWNWTYSSSIPLTAAETEGSTITFRGSFSTANANDTYYNVNVIRLNNVVISQGIFNKLTFENANGSHLLCSSAVIETDSLVLQSSIVCQLHNNIIVNEYLEAKPSACGGLIHIQSNAAAQRTITYGGTPTDIQLENIRLRNILVSGSDIPYTITNGIDDGGNSTGLWNFLPPAAGKTLYWVGGSGNWSDPENWSTTSGGTYPSTSGCVPTPFDDVIFNDASSAANYTVTLNENGYCNNMSWIGTGTTIPTFTMGYSIMEVHGSLELQTGMNLSASVTNIVSGFVMNTDKPGQTLRTNGVTLSSIRFISPTKPDGSEPGGWVLQDALNVSIAGQYNVINFHSGSLDFNGQNVRARFNGLANSQSATFPVWTGSWFSYGTGGHNSGYYSPNRTLNIANSTITSVAWTYSGGQPLTQANSANSLITISGGSMTAKANDYYHNVQFTGTSSGGITNGNYNNVTYLSTVGTINANVVTDSLEFLTNGTFSIAAGVRVHQYLGTNDECGGNVIIRSSVVGTQRTITMTTDSIAHPVVNVSYITLQDIRIAGPDIPYEAVASTDNGNNAGWIFTDAAPKTLYWVGGTGDWSDVSNWSIYSAGGTPPAQGYKGDGTGCVPLITDNVIFDEWSFTAANQIVTMDVVAACDSMSWIGLESQTPTFQINSSLRIGGSLLLQKGMLWNSANVGNSQNVVTFTSSRTGEQIKTSGVAINSNIAFNGTGGWQLQDAFTMPTASANISRGIVTFTNGNLDFNGQDVSINSFNGSAASSTSTLNIAGSVITTRGTFNPVWSYSGAAGSTLTAANSTIKVGGYNTNSGFTAKTSDTYNNIEMNYSGGFITNAVANKIYFTQSGTINNIVTDSLIFTPGRTYSFTAGTTSTINEYWFGSGTPCLMTTIKSTIDGTQARLSVAKAAANLNFNTLDADTLLMDRIQLRDIYALTTADAGGDERAILEKGDKSPDTGIPPTGWGINGNNTNWIMNAFVAESINPFGPDIFTCEISDLKPITLSSVRFLPTPEASFEWRYSPDGTGNPNTWAIVGSNPTFDAIDIGTYRLTVDYAPGVGAGCPLSGQISIFLSGDTMVWTPVGGSTDWNDIANWANANPPGVAYVPTECDNVIIPAGRASYPDLSPAGTTYDEHYPIATCFDIWFEHGGEVRRTDSLHYNHAYIDMELNSNQWYMLSAPLKNTYSGDFYVDNHNPIFDLGGQGMLVYMQHFDIANYQSGAPKIDYNWNNAFNTNDIEIEAGQGFALFANPRNTAYTDNDPMVFPFPKDDRFHYYWSILGAPTGRGADLDRTHYGRFIYEDNNYNPPAGGLVPLSHSSLAAGEMVLVGNPFMAQLDFDAFYQDNQSLIYNEYKLAYGIGNDGAMADFGTWKGGSDAFAGNPVATDPELTQYIAPMQSFIVYAKQNGGQLRADIVNHTTTITAAPGASTLKSSSSDDKELLYITASRGKQKSNAVIVHWNQGDKNFRPAEDSRKLFDEKATASVLVYLLSSDGIALDINTTNDLQEMIPIGIRTSQLGKITLNFSGMEEFQNKKIQLHDTKENRIINLNEEDEYSFFKMEEALHIENRFFISFTDYLGIDNVNNSEIFISNPERNTIRVYSPKTIQNIEILDIQGRILTRENNINNTTYDYQVNTAGVYIVRTAGQTKKVVVK